MLTGTARLAQMGALTANGIFKIQANVLGPGRLEQ